MRIFGGDQVAKVMGFLKMPEDVPIEHSMVSKAIEGAQKKVEGHNFDIRKHTVEYDDVMNQQRQIIYGIRKQVLEEAEKKEGSLKEQILEKVVAEITKIVTAHSEERLDSKKVIEEFCGIIPLDEVSWKELEKQISQMEVSEEVINILTGLSKRFYEEREEKLGLENSKQLEVFIYLSVMDSLWMEHLDTIDDLRAGIGLRGYGGRDPLIEYKREAFDLFERLVLEIDWEIVHRIYKVAFQQAPQVQPQEAVEIRPAVDISLEQETADSRPESVIRSNEIGETKVTIERGGQVIAQETYGGEGQLTKSHGKIGRNDPCYCGSGKKYKKCHYPN